MNVFMALDSYLIHLSDVFGETATFFWSAVDILPSELARIYPWSTNGLKWNTEI